MKITIKGALRIRVGRKICRKCLLVSRKGILFHHHQRKLKKERLEAKTTQARELRTIARLENPRSHALLRSAGELSASMARSRFR